MEDYFYKKDLWKSLEGKTKNQGSMTNDDWHVLDRKELGSIWLCLAPLMAFKYYKSEDGRKVDGNGSKIVWKALRFKQGISHEAFI